MSGRPTRDAGQNIFNQSHTLCHGKVQKRQGRDCAVKCQFVRRAQCRIQVESIAFVNMALRETQSQFARKGRRKLHGMELGCIQTGFKDLIS